jgi:versiconal hemiacetal acetate esterase
MVPVTLHWNNTPAEYKEDYRSYEENAENVPIINKATMESFYGEPPLRWKQSI